MNTTVFESHSIRNQLITGILVLQSVLLLALLKSTPLSLLLGACICIALLLFFFPEFGLALSLTGIVLPQYIFDNLTVPIPTPVIVTYMLLLLGGLILYSFKRAIGTHIPPGILHHIALLIGIVLLVGSLYSRDPDYGRRKLLFYALMNLPVMYLPLLLCEQIRKMKNILLFAFILGLILSVICLFRAQNMPSFSRFRLSDSVNPIWLARSLGFSLLAGLYFISRTRRKSLKIILFTFLPLLFYPLMLSGSRAPFIGLILAVLAFYVFQPQIPLSRKCILSTFAIAGAIVFIVISGSNLAARVSAPTTTDIVSTAGRFAAWLQSFRDFLSSPLIGIGTGSFRIEFFMLTIIYPHNIVLEMTAEHGIVGLCLISAFLILSLRYAFKNIKTYDRAGAFVNTQLSIAVLSLYLYALWNAMFSGDITANPLLWLASGFIWILYKNREKEDKLRKDHEEK